MTITAMNSKKTIQRKKTKIKVAQAAAAADCPKSCDMKGFLSFVVLRLINNHPMCGQSIRDEIAARKGSMPSPGTIYPVLRQLSDAGWIREVACENSKEKRYEITASGKKEAALATKRFVTYFSDMKGEF